MNQLYQLFDNVVASKCNSILLQSQHYISNRIINSRLRLTFLQEHMSCVERVRSNILSHVELDVPENITPTQQKQEWDRRGSPRVYVRPERSTPHEGWFPKISHASTLPKPMEEPELVQWVNDNLCSMIRSLVYLSSMAGAWVRPKGPGGGGRALGRGGRDIYIYIYVYIYTYIYVIYIYSNAQMYIGNAHIS